MQLKCISMISSTFNITYLFCTFFVYLYAVHTLYSVADANLILVCIWMSLSFFKAFVVDGVDAVDE